MAEEGVVGATWQEATAHPYVVGAAVAGLVIIFWWLGRAKAPASTPQQFAFSYGPSDAQVRAGTALQIAQQTDQTQLGLAQIQSGTDLAQIDAGVTTSKDYYDYLTSNSANNLSLGITQSNNSAQVANWDTFYGSLRDQSQIQASIINNQITTAAQLQLNAQQNNLAALLRPNQ